MWTELQHIDSRLTFHIVHDGDNGSGERYDVPHYVHIVQVPQSYKPRCAQHKARTLEFFRRSVRLQEDDCVLHLDEETQLDAYAIKTVIDFIERSDRLLGMGTILYNTGAYWRNPILTTAETYRVVGDWGSFRLPVSLFKRPLGGWLHGSFILINGDVENKITWDTSCIAEDYWFGLQAAKLRIPFGWIDAIAREQPPMSVGDLINQRRRWFSGIWSTGAPTARLAYSCHIWSLLGNIHTIYCLTLRSGTLVLPLWVVNWTSFNMAQLMFSAASCSLMQDIDAGGFSVPAMAWHMLFTWMLSPMYSALEAMVKVYAIWYPPRGFHVIDKT